MSDSTLYLYTSLTAGSSHIVTATARVETILKANKLPFRAIDVATDEAARKLWGRRSRGKKLPGLVKYGDIVGDLEEIEEWNEFGELRMVVNSVQDLGGLPATSNPVSTPPTSTPKEPEPGTPKPSTIKIQSPPAKTEEKKDDKAVLALRQASAEAASKAKNKTEDKKQSVVPPKDESESKKADVDPTPETKAHRGSVAAELPDTAPDSPKGAKRPPLVPEVAAVSSANFHADNAEELGLVEHHRGSIVSATDKDEQEKVVSDIRQSITGEDAGGLEAVRKEAARKTQESSIEEEPTSSDGKSEAKDSADLKDTTETQKATEPKDEPEDTKDTKEDTTATQDPKSAEAATESVKD